MTIREIRLVLIGSGGELDRRVIMYDTEKQDEAEVIHHVLSKAIGNWTLSVGDTIKIVEVVD